MPCLNEALTLPDCLREARETIERLGVRGEILIADNGSTDGSQDIAEAAGARVVPVAQRGYGHALNAGIHAAKGRYIFMADADGSYDFRECGPLLETLRAGADIAMGNRFAGGIHPGAMPWKNRYIGNPVLSFLGRLFFKIPTRDFHCGLRGGSKRALTGLDLRTGGMEFASEMVIKASLSGLKMAESPVSLRPDGRDRPPHLRPWRDGWRHLRFMLLFNPRWLFMLPGLALLLGGFIGFAVLLRGPLEIGSITLDVHTLLYAAAAILCGFQAVAFAALSKVFVHEAGLAPKTSRMNKNPPFAGLTIERSIVVAVVLAALGLGLSFEAVHRWKQAAFGNLSPSEILRWAVPAVTCLVLSMQLTLAGFFVDMMRLRLRR
ncbi:glycosyltransferase family 2 protein [Synoicihabitans lomoniglobus]|uniref:Glycosyltransferase family 2 protein n=1 Tax=Synoicihabitans lomoniglobus TaxID=2909285 RepID=A0AAF0I6E5_9BACT|nr:glycosyltransferase family 2 protein [Opitutaceae bacterium LMO-M01]WED67515.1 glycosyltransferase family 2 protein [Opitutaceae bacterium LMO-M01]